MQFVFKKFYEVLKKYWYMLQKSMMKETKMTQIHHLGNLVSLRNSNVEKRTQNLLL